MAFRLKPAEPPRRGLRRILRKQLDDAIAALDGEFVSDERVHEARKHIKKARTVVNLAEGSLKLGKARDDLRHAAHLLSRLRDASAITDDAVALCKSARGTVSTEACQALLDTLRHNKTHAVRSARRHRATERAKAALDRVRFSMKQWKWSDLDRKAFDAAIQRSYKRARRRMQTAEEDSDNGKAFHEWRKRVKTLWFTLRLLDASAPALERAAADLARLEEWLGQEHNLHVLRTKTARQLSSPDDGKEISALAAKRQRRLRRMALSTGARVFKERPKRYVKQLREEE